MTRALTAAARSLDLVRIAGAVRDYVSLTKPRITLLVLLTAAAGFWLASGPSPDLVLLGHTLFGTALVAAGTSAMNQVLEREVDGRMERTRTRPLPAGRLRTAPAAAFPSRPERFCLRSAGRVRAIKDSSGVASSPSLVTEGASRAEVELLR